MAKRVNRVRGARSPGPTAIQGSRPRSGSLRGVGIDLVSQERIAKLYERRGAALARKILCARELKEFRAGRKQPAHYLASAFAAKEAFAKALGTGFRGLDHRDAGVVREANGRPVLVYTRALAARLKREGIVAAHVSLSDEGGFVCALVVLESA